MKRLALALTLATLAALPVRAETLTLKTVDFKLPLGIVPPKGTKKKDIFVDDTFCFYVRQNWNFIRIGCVG